MRRGQRCIYVREVVEYAKNIPKECSFAGRSERRARNRMKLGSDGKWRAVGGYARVGSARARSSLNFLWNLLTIKYEPGRSVILNFRMCPPGLSLFPYSAMRVSPFPGRASEQTNGAHAQENDARFTSFAGYIHHLQRAVFNFHERFPDLAFEEKNIRGRGAGMR